MQRLLAAGDLGSRDLVWHEGMADWLPAGEVAELGSGGPAPALAGSAMGGFPAGAGRPGLVAQRQGLALASMICGIVAIFGLCVWLGLPAGIAAVVLGHMAKSRIRRDPGSFTGKGMATAGLVTGYLAIVASLLLGLGTYWLMTADPAELEFLPPEARERILQDRGDAGLGTPAAETDQ